MSNQPDLVRCEDCTCEVHMTRSVLVAGDLVCEACATHRASEPAIFTPVWTRLWHALGGKPASHQR